MITSAMKQNHDEYFHSHFEINAHGKMGNRFGQKRTLSNQDVQRYSQQTQLQPYVIRQIHDAFIDRAGKDGR